MSKVAYTNKTDGIQHIGPCTVWPGQTREVDERDLPITEGNESPVPPVNDQSTIITEMLGQTIPKISELLPSQSDELLDALELAEQAGEARKGVLADITAERLSRADAAKSAEEYAQLIADYTLEDLQAELKNTNDEGLKGILQAEIEKRNDNG